VTRERRLFDEIWEKYSFNRLRNENEEFDSLLGYTCEEGKKLCEVE
jgi:hypothetical protein